MKRPNFIDLMQTNWIDVHLVSSFILNWILLGAMACGWYYLVNHGKPVQEIIHNGVKGVLVPMGYQSKLALRSLGLLSIAPVKEKLCLAARGSALSWNEGVLTALVKRDEVA